ncbi:hypothetical protein SCFA_3910006 [anaerobic digester metagenome]|uniref:Uncharacterized protein n=1 Tax=anaerobic digester metagenome TaxID=1263854 RepID=A0A485M7Q8_9ZZZZ
MFFWSKNYIELQYPSSTQKILYISLIIVTISKGASIYTSTIEKDIIIR